jgi:hypothetical protein
MTRYGVTTLAVWVFLTAACVGVWLLVAAAAL